MVVPLLAVTAEWWWLGLGTSAQLSTLKQNQTNRAGLSQRGGSGGYKAGIRSGVLSGSARCNMQFITNDGCIERRKSGGNARRDKATPKEDGTGASN